jgi:hypothetical protein
METMKGNEKEKMERELLSEKQILSETIVLKDIFSVKDLSMATFVLL